MNVRDFEYLVELGKSESISKASKALYISQPALSKYLQKIEAEAGTPLFQRVGHRLIPTFAGTECIKIASEILFLNNKMQQTLSDISKQNKGEIRFGMPLSRSNFFIYKILPLFYKEYSNICVSIYEDSTHILIQKLRSGELDLILVNNTDAYTDLECHIISEEEMVLAAPTAYHLSEKGFILDSYKYPCLSPSSWLEYPFLMLSKDQKSRAYAEDYISANHLEPNIILVIRNLDHLLYSVRMGMGVTICPSIPFASDVENTLEYFSLPTETGPMTQKTVLMYRKDAYLSVPEKILMWIIEKNYGIG